MRNSILCIEDHPLSLRLVHRMLESLGYDAQGASDGETGLQIAAATRPHLILLDMDLPDMDGWTLARLMKSDHRLRHIPIIALTGNAQPGDRERCLNAGCDGYLTKPVSRHDLQDIIRHFLPAGDVAV